MNNENNATIDPIDTTNPTESTTATTNWERVALEKYIKGNLAEQKSSRRWRNAIRLGWLLLCMVVAWVIFHESSPNKTNQTIHTAVVEIKGTIDSESNANAHQLMTSLRLAFEEKNAKAIVLLINSPGGSPVQAGMVYDELKRLKAIHKKPVYAVIEEMGASAAYYIAVGADKIYVDKASIVGSIGVLMDGFGFTGLMDKLGIERRLLTAGENKGFLDPFSPQNAKHKEFAQTMLIQIHQQFINTVKEGRGVRLKNTSTNNPDLFSGLFWSGEQAVQMGLADELGTLDSVARDVVKASELVDYTHRDNVAEKLAKRFGAAIGEGSVKALQNATLQMH